jgi:hypothetical protein
VNNLGNYAAKTSYITHHLHLSAVGEKRSAFRILVRKSFEKSPFGRPCILQSFGNRTVEPSCFVNTVLVNNIYQYSQEILIQKTLTKQILKDYCKR